MTARSPALAPQALAQQGPRRVQFGPDTAWAETHRQDAEEILRYQVLGERSSGTSDQDTLFASHPFLRHAKSPGFMSLTNRACNYVFVRFEEVRVDPEAFVEMLHQEFGVLRTTPFKSVETWLGTLPPDQEIRQSGASSEAISDDDLNFVCDTLDAALEAQVGYTLPERAAS